MKKDTQKRERLGRVLIPLFCLIVIFCTTGLFLCYANGRTSKVDYEASDEIISVAPDFSVNVVNFDFTIEYSKNRRCSLIIYDVMFDGDGLSFADMNEGQWEYSVDGGIWRPLILANGECVLKTNISVGEKNLLLRVTEDLDVKAAKGSLTFKLKLKENTGDITLWILIGVITGGVFAAVGLLLTKTVLKTK